MDVGLLRAYIPKVGMAEVGFEVRRKVGRCSAVPRVVHPITNPLPVLVSTENVHRNRVESQNRRDCEPVIPFGPVDLAVPPDNHQRFEMVGIRVLEGVILGRFLVSRRRVRSIAFSLDAVEQLVDVLASDGSKLSQTLVSPDRLAALELLFRPPVQRRLLPVAFFLEPLLQPSVQRRLTK